MTVTRFTCVSKCRVHRQRLHGRRHTMASTRHAASLCVRASHRRVPSRTAAPAANAPLGLRDCGLRVGGQQSGIGHTHSERVSPRSSMVGRGIDTVLGRRYLSGEAAKTKYDEVQARLMAERCILVDENDTPVGSTSKESCHLASNIRSGASLSLHRAFSVFLFDERDRLLLQRRSAEKITFPGLWTNTCCSHPLNVDGETESKDALGVKRAAIRKLEHELGINDPAQINLDTIDYITRIHYKAFSDDTWGEHEIDYILFVRARSPVLSVNRNEVSETLYVTKDELRTRLQEGTEVTPWFKLICESSLFHWWDSLNSLEGIKNHSTIHRLN